MRLLRDYRGRPIRLTDERLAHVLSHPEMMEMDKAIDETIANPEQIVESKTDNTVKLYYRSYSETKLGRKLLCVVVKESGNPFIVTAYLTDKIKGGRILWEKDKR